VLTEWDEFVQYDWQKKYTIPCKSLLFDGRNILDRSQMESIGFVYQAIGS
jgi:UDPglucose 6-dehydrogenase